jgi:hypothetical protein
MCLNGTYSNIRTGKHLSGIFPIQNGLKEEMINRSYFFNFALGYLRALVCAVMKLRVT